MPAQGACDLEQDITVLDKLMPKSLEGRAELGGSSTVGPAPWTRDRGLPVPEFGPHPLSRFVYSQLEQAPRRLLALRGVAWPLLGAELNRRLTGSRQGSECLLLPLEPTLLLCALGLTLSAQEKANGPGGFSFASVKSGKNCGTLRSVSWSGPACSHTAWEGLLEGLAGGKVGNLLPPADACWAPSGARLRRAAHLSHLHLGSLPAL